MPRGRRPLPWIKLWFDIIGDPKIAQLSAVERWCWVGILLLAGQSPVRGKLMLSDAKPMNENDIYRALKLSPKEQKLLKTCISKMTDMDSLKWNNSCLEVIHFKDRQEVFVSDLIDYHKKKSTELTPDKLLKTPELTPDLLQKEGEGRGERRDATTTSENLAKISRLYEENIGMLSPVAAELLKDIADRYPPGWFAEALKEAVANERRNLKYITTILERWKVEGFKSKKVGRSDGKPRQERAKGPLTYIIGNAPDDGSENHADMP